MRCSTPTRHCAYCATVSVPCATEAVVAMVAALSTAGLASDRAVLDSLLCSCANPTPCPCGPGGAAARHCCSWRFSGSASAPTFLSRRNKQRTAFPSSAEPLLKHNQEIREGSVGHCRAESSPFETRLRENEETAKCAREAGSPHMSEIGKTRHAQQQVVGRSSGDALGAVSAEAQQRQHRLRAQRALEGRAEAMRGQASALLFR